MGDLTEAQVRALEMYEAGQKQTRHLDCPYDEWRGLLMADLIHLHRDCTSTITPAGIAALARQKETK